MIDNANIIQTDIETSNGVIHVIDAVVIPSEPYTVDLRTSDELGKYMVDSEGMTLYYFTNDKANTSNCSDVCIERWPAFYADEINVPSELDPAEFGEITRSDGSKQSTFRGWPLYYFYMDEASGETKGQGVNEVWFVLNPDSLAPAPEPLVDIVDTAIAAGSFDTLVAAVQAAGLEDTLRSEGPFTVFAPTDDAFAALPEGTLESLLMPENLDQLTSILTYHVVSGELMAADVVTMNSIATVNGQSLTVTVADGQVMIDNANIIQTDIETSNGVIHVIDAVVIPEEENVKDYDNVYFVELYAGLNMISLPLEPAEPYTARSFAEYLDATGGIE
jgi:uncharacterized surface protein with fasciclin (FAS1) repeats